MPGTFKQKFKPRKVFLPINKGLSHGNIFCFKLFNQINCTKKKSMILKPWTFFIVDMTYLFCFFR